MLFYYFLHYLNCGTYIRSLYNRHLVFYPWVVKKCIYVPYLKKVGILATGFLRKEAKNDEKRQKPRRKIAKNQGKSNNYLALSFL